MQLMELPGEVKRVERIGYHLHPCTVVGSISGGAGSPQGAAQLAHVFRAEKRQLGGVLAPESDFAEFLPPPYILDLVVVRPHPAAAFAEHAAAEVGQQFLYVSAGVPEQLRIYPHVRTVQYISRACLVKHAVTIAHVPGEFDHRVYHPDIHRRDNVGAESEPVPEEEPVQSFRPGADQLLVRGSCFRHKPVRPVPRQSASQTVQVYPFLDFRGRQVRDARIEEHSQFLARMFLLQALDDSIVERVYAVGDRAALRQTGGTAAIGFAVIQPHRHRIRIRTPVEILHGGVDA